jgi:uncharacterized repeat protein (TIGR03803 family)
MTNRLEEGSIQRLTMWIGRRIATAGLALAATLGLVATQSAQAQVFTDLHCFGVYYDGEAPYAGVTIDPATGNIYGTTYYSGAGGTVFEISSVCSPLHCRQETVLRHFNGWNGSNPAAPLVEDAAGNLYGTTVYGGTGNGGGNGVVFKVGEGNALYMFKGAPDGANPYAGLIVDSAGNLYGTTTRGGVGIYGSGTVFKLDTAGAETVLYSFTGGKDGGFPYGSLLMDSAGNLYGTTSGGGAFGAGTVFKLDTSGTETVLYTFTGNRDGSQPMAGLLMDSDGNLYGTTPYGGNKFSCSIGCGVVFKLDIAGNETVLHSFNGPPDGATPYAGLVMDPAGNLYGATLYGGTMDRCDYSNTAKGCGTVFKIDATGAESIVHSFRGPGYAGGAEPYGTLAIDSAGNLYGTTYTGGCGGSDELGLVFEITP